jgi:hypothetical protein
MTGPDYCFQRTDTSADSRRDARGAEARCIEVLRPIAVVGLQLLRLSTDLLVDMERASDAAGAALTGAFAPDVVLGVPPLVLLGRFEEPEPPLDHRTFAPRHRRPGGHVEQTVGKPGIAGFEIEVSGLAHSWRTRTPSLSSRHPIDWAPRRQSAAAPRHAARVNPTNPDPA